MTFSIVVFDKDSKKLGIAVATCHLAVGALVPHLKSGLAAIATQAATNPYLGLKGLEKMSNGYSLKDALMASLSEDVAKDSRQLHGVDVLGNAWAWTGKDTVQWSGHKIGTNFSLAGNMLVGEQVLEACHGVIKSRNQEPLEEILLEGLKAGEAVGGDVRGRQSAALLTIKDQPFPFCHLRVDDSRDPLSELEHLLKEFRKPYYQEFIDAIPN
ncbi:DUF1028 domain-containing protein [Deltaproteobacteria bacterium]|jgi:uncharacterized Ntn-hydrolase superfamily protein|nr:DUF1028 domain-containing protein [Deltaproteobacteria bacterium]|tara:strand:+ start:5587 stop:6225 length:639 start_codon:yes stop_codon:yes gene_type:complete